MCHGPWLQGSHALHRVVGVHSRGRRLLDHHLFHSPEEGRHEPCSQRRSATPHRQFPGQSQRNVPCTPCSWAWGHPTVPETIVHPARGGLRLHASDDNRCLPTTDLESAVNQTDRSCFLRWIRRVPRAWQGTATCFVLFGPEKVPRQEGVKQGDSVAPRLPWCLDTMPAQCPWNASTFGSTPRSPSRKEVFGIRGPILHYRQATSPPAVH